MTNQQILTKAIQKAIDGGWETKLAEKVKDGYQWRSKIISQPELFIFNHGFAKALWGEEPSNLLHFPAGPSDKQIIEAENIPQWQYHLQQMVIADDPIAYLGENI